MDKESMRVSVVKVSPEEMKKHGNHLEEYFKEQELTPIQAILVCETFIEYLSEMVGLKDIKTLTGVQN